jgi:IS30 family transposase
MTEASGNTKQIAMPGGGLTRQDRRQIVPEPADGLAYVEIVRGLDRPTSTITREVMRNGNPTAYRVDLAHRATARRVHRSLHGGSEVETAVQVEAEPTVGVDVCPEQRGQRLR